MAGARRRVVTILLGTVRTVGVVGSRGMVKDSMTAAVAAGARKTCVPGRLIAEPLGMRVCAPKKVLSTGSYMTIVPYRDVRIATEVESKGTVKES